MNGTLNNYIFQPIRLKILNELIWFFTDQARIWWVIFFFIVRIEDAGRANCRSFIMLTVILQIFWCWSVWRGRNEPNFRPFQLIVCLMSGLFSADWVEGAGWAKFCAFSANHMFDEWSICSRLGWRCWLNQILGPFQLIGCSMSDFQPIALKVLGEPNFLRDKTGIVWCLVSGPFLKRIMLYIIISNNYISLESPSHFSEILTTDCHSG